MLSNVEEVMMDERSWGTLKSGKSKGICEFLYLRITSSGFS